MATLAPDQATVPLDDFGVASNTRVDGVGEVETTGSELVVATIPDITLSKEEREAMEIWIGEQIELAKSERADLEELWKLIQEMYEKFELEDKDFPYEDSAHLVIPITATYSEMVWSKIINTIFSSHDPMSARPLRKEFINAAKSLRTFMTWAAREELNLEEVMSSILLEGVKLGTYVGKAVYTIEERTIWLYDPSTRKYTKTTQRMKDHPEIVHVPRADFFFRIGTAHQDDCVWKAHRIKLTWNDILRRKADGRFNADQVDEFLTRWKEGSNKNKKPEPAAPTNSRTPYEQSRDKAIGVDPLPNDEFEFYEIWYEYHVPSVDKLPIKLVGMFEPTMRMLFRVQHNWFPLQLDPFEVGVYIPRENRIDGIGVGSMTIAFGNEITAMHNQRLDNATVANASVTFVQEDSTMPLNLKIKPGGTYGVPNPKDINIQSLGQKYDSTIAEEKHTLSMVQQRIGMMDYMEQNMGNTSTQAIMNMQELTRRFDIIIRNVRRFMSRLMHKCLLLYQQHYPDGKVMTIMGEDGSYIEELWKMPQKTLRYGVAVEVTATTSSTSRELERQNKLSLFNMMTQYYGQLTQYVIQANNTQMPEEVRETMLIIVQALGYLVDDILNDYDFQGRDRIVIDEETKRAFRAERIQQQPSRSQVAPNPGGTPGATSDALNAQLASIQQRLANATQGR